MATEFTVKTTADKLEEDVTAAGIKEGLSEAHAAAAASTAVADMARFEAEHPDHKGSLSATVTMHGGVDVDPTLAGDEAPGAISVSLEPAGRTRGETGE